MDSIFKARRFAGSLLVAAVFIGGCSERGSPIGPPPPAPPPPPPGPAPVITSISPATGSTGGGALMQIVGTKFRTGAFAIFDGVTVRGRSESTLSTLVVETPPHPDGTIDIEVSNADGASTRVVGGHTYVSPSSFDPNTSWYGVDNDSDHRVVSFLIENNRLVSAFCGAGEFVPLTWTGTVVVAGGEFAITQGEAIVASGRIVSSTEMIGTMSFGPCTSMTWRAHPSVKRSMW